MHLREVVEEEDHHRLEGEAAAAEEAARAFCIDAMRGSTRVLLCWRQSSLSKSEGWRTWFFEGARSTEQLPVCLLGVTAGRFRDKLQPIAGGSSDDGYAMFRGVNVYQCCKHKVEFGFQLSRVRCSVSSSGLGCARAAQMLYAVAWSFAPPHQDRWQHLMLTWGDAVQVQAAIN